MSKRNLDWNQEKFNKYIKEGRGAGIGKDYKPWVTVQTFPSYGREHKVLGWKTNRIHEFMSDNEFKYFYILEWSENVLDIREQFPLLNLERIMNIANDLGITYPIAIDNTPYIFSTDFFITISYEGREKQIARTIKPANMLDDSEVIEKFELERRYWESFDIDWGIVTEKDMPEKLAQNIKWIHNSRKQDDSIELSIDEKLNLLKTLKGRLLSSRDSIRNITSNLDGEMFLENGTGLSLFKYLLANKEIALDMNAKIDLSKPSIEVILESLPKESNEIGGVQNE